MPAVKPVRTSRDHDGQAAEAPRVRGMREDRLRLGASAHLPGVRRRRCAATTRPIATPPARAASSHPVIASAEPGERWLFCYPDDAFAEDRIDGGDRGLAIEAPKLVCARGSPATAR